MCVINAVSKDSYIFILLTQSIMIMASLQGITFVFSLFLVCFIDGLKCLRMEEIQIFSQVRTGRFLFSFSNL